MLGFASFEKEVNDNQTIALNKLYLCPRHYGSGLGRLLMEEIEASAKSQGAKVLSLYVLDSNENAAGFYQKQGFAFGKGSVSEVFEGVTIIDVLMEKQL
ncbi:GNAT family N-acetyltransferase [Enterovibrio coralii]|uniref:GNAT family N-acetyltransferase n=1 Tax=Enterovibrio coralii TaxID=294935 RepID=UPI000AFB4777|nr:GNAT family N-acetyltransferase [Enterovibrio coralii]